MTSLERVIEQRIEANLRSELQRAGVTERKGVVVSPQELSLGQVFKPLRRLTDELRAKLKAGVPATATQSEIVTAMRPMIRRQAKALAKGIKLGVRRSAAEVKAGALTQTTVPAMARARRVMRRMRPGALPPPSGVPDASDFGHDLSSSTLADMLGLSFTETRDDERTVEDFGQLDVDEGGEAFGALDVEGAGEAFGDVYKAESGAAAFGDVYKAESGAAAFGQMYMPLFRQRFQPRAKVGQKIVTKKKTVPTESLPAEGYVWVFHKEVKIAGKTFYGWRQAKAPEYTMALRKPPMPGPEEPLDERVAKAVRPVSKEILTADTFFQWPETAWDFKRAMVAPQSRPPGAPGTARLAVVAAKSAVDAMRRTGSVVGAKQELAAGGLTPPRVPGSPETAGEQAYEAVAKGLARKGIVLPSAVKPKQKVKPKPKAEKKKTFLMYLPKWLRRGMTRIG